MTDLKRDILTCPNCGAPINRLTMRCEYCGAVFTDHTPNFMMCVENPKVDILKASAFVPYGLCESGTTEILNKFVREELARKLLAAVIDETEITVKEDPAMDGLRVTGRLRVVRKGERI